MTGPAYPMPGAFCKYPFIASGQSRGRAWGLCAGHRRVRPLTIEFRRLPRQSATAAHMALNVDRGAIRFRPAGVSIAVWISP